MPWGRPGKYPGDALWKPWACPGGCPGEFLGASRRGPGALGVPWGMPGEALGMPWGMHRCALGPCGSGQTTTLTTKAEAGANKYFDTEGGGRGKEQLRQQNQNKRTRGYWETK